MNVNLKDLNIGDTVTFRGGGKAEVRGVKESQYGNYPYNINFTKDPFYVGDSFTKYGKLVRSREHPLDIVKIIPKPFDFDTVKQGMAFKSPMYGTVYYIANDPTESTCFIASQETENIEPDDLIIVTKEAIRLPEEDIDYAYSK